MLSVQHLRKEFTSVVAVDDISFNVRRGQIFGLIGPNGAGKSTTIRMIMDIIQPDRGQVLIDDRQTDKASKNITGYLPEERGLYRKNKLLNVISYFAGLKGLSTREARATPTMARAAPARAHTSSPSSSSSVPPTLGSGSSRSTTRRWV